MLMRFWLVGRMGGGCVLEGGRGGFHAVAWVDGWEENEEGRVVGGLMTLGIGEGWCVERRE